MDSGPVASWGLAGRRIAAGRSVGRCGLPAAVHRASLAKIRCAYLTPRYGCERKASYKGYYTNASRNEDRIRERSIYRIVAIARPEVPRYDAGGT